MTLLRVGFLVDRENWALAHASEQAISHSRDILGEIFTAETMPDDLTAYDVILCYRAFNSGLADKLKKYPTVPVISGGNQSSQLHRDLFGEMWPDAKVGATVAEHLTEEYQRAYPGMTWLTLSHGIDTETFFPRASPAEGLTAGWAGDPSCVFKRVELLQAVQEGADIDMILSTDTPYSDMPLFYHSLDIYLSVSSHEAHPMPVYEAMASGLPVITTDAGDVGRYIIDGVNGYIVPWHFPAPAIQAIIDRLKDPETRSRVGAAARNTIRSRMSWERVLQEGYPTLISIYGKPELEPMRQKEKPRPEAELSWLDQLPKVIGEEEWNRTEPLIRHYFRTQERPEAITSLFTLFHLEPPSISLIIPTRDRARVLGRALASVCREGYPSLEIHVIDSRSKGMNEVKQKYKGRVIFTDRKPHKCINDGGYKTNIGLKNASNDYIALLGDDDEHADGGYTLLGLYLAMHPNTFAVFGDYKIHDFGSGSTSNAEYRGIVDFNSLLKGNYIGGLTLLYKNDKSIWMDEHDRYGDDWDRWLYIMARHGWARTPVMGGTVNVGESFKRMGDKAVEENYWQERQDYHHDIAVSEYSRDRHDGDLRICILSHSYGQKPFGGSANNHWNVMDSLTQGGLDVTMITDRPDNVYYQNEQHPHKVMSWKDWKQIDNPRDRWNVFHVMAGPGYVHELNRRGIKPICGSNIVTNCGIEELAPYGDDNLNTPGKWRLARQEDEQLLHSCDAMFWVAQSEFQTRCYRELCKYKGPVHLFPNTIDPERFRGAGSNLNLPKRILWTGSRARGKGAAEFQKLVRMMPDIEFIVMSETEIGLEGENILPIYGGGMDLMPELYGLGCILLTTSHCENQPLGVIEAMMSSMPAVAWAPMKTPHGISEVITQGKTGFLVPWQDLDSMERTLRALLTNDKKRKQMGTAAERYAIDTFSYEATRPGMIQVYKKYLDMMME